MSKWENLDVEKYEETCRGHRGPSLTIITPAVLLKVNAKHRVLGMLQGDPAGTV